MYSGVVVVVIIGTPVRKYLFICFICLVICNGYPHRLQCLEFRIDGVYLERVVVIFRGSVVDSFVLCASLY